MFNLYPHTFSFSSVSQDKRVSIVHGDHQLLNSTYPPSLRQGLATRLLARGIELLLNEYVDSFPEQGTVGLVTRKGTNIPDADLVVRTLRALCLSSF